MTVRSLLASGSEADPIRSKPREMHSARAAHAASYWQRGSISGGMPTRVSRF